MISQSFLFVFSGMAIWMVSGKKPWKRWGYLVGLMGQPFWFYAAIVSEQWGILLLTCWYTYAWSRGVWNYIIKDYWEWR